MSQTRNDGEFWKWGAIIGGLSLLLYVGAYLATMTPYRTPWIVVPWYTLPGMTPADPNRVDEWLDIVFRPAHWIDQRVRSELWTPAEQFPPPVTNY